MGTSDTRQQAGALRHRVTIQTFTTTRASDGGVTRSWADSTKRWASVQPLTGREFFDAMQVDSDLTHVVTMRKYTSITTEDRIVFDGRNLNVESVRNIDERGRKTVCMCKEDT